MWLIPFFPGLMEQFIYCKKEWGQHMNKSRVENCGKKELLPRILFEVTVLFIPDFINLFPGI